MGGIIFGYWKIRGAGQYIRHLLAYTETEFIEVQYQKRQKWFEEDKKDLGFDFPNLPYLIDGDFKLTEAIAIAKYIIKRSGKTQLLGKDTLDQAKVNNLIGVFNDAYKGIRGLCFDKNFQAKKAAELEMVKPKFQYLKSFIGDRPFAMDYLTIFDFIISELLYHFEAIYPNQIKNYGFWWRIRENFENIPQIQAYYKRPDAIVEPFLPSIASITPKRTSVKFGYWNLRGTAQVQRLLLGYSGVEFQDKTYAERESWLNGDKLTLGLDFPNIPYLYDGNNSITETTAIQRYIIERWGKKQLLGKNIRDNAKIESFISCLSEVIGEIRSLFFNKDYKTARVPVLEKFSGKLAQLNQFVGPKGHVLDYLTLADFLVAEDSYYIEAMFPEQYKKWPFLQRVRQQFQRIPEIIAYYKRPTAFKGKFLPEQAALSIDK